MSTLSAFNTEIKYTQPNLFLEHNHSHYLYNRCISPARVTVPACQDELTRVTIQLLNTSELHYNETQRISAKGQYSPH